MTLSARFLICYSVAILQVTSGTAHSQATTAHSEQGSTKVGGTSAPHISDHRFFLKEIFTKYGHDGQMTFEGFEHLLESLGLGNIIITDHDLTAHKEDAFRNIHDTHDHSKKVDAGDHGVRKGSKDHSHETASPHNPHKRRPDYAASYAALSTRTSNSPDLSSHSHSFKQGSTPAIKYENGVYQGHSQLHEEHTASPKSNLRYPASPGYTSSQRDESSTQMSKIQGNTPLNPTDNIYHYRLPDGGIPELLVNITSLVDQHQELEDNNPDMIIEQCLSPKEILETFGINQTSSLNPVSFLHLCPAIIYELDQGHCMFRDYSHKKHRSVVTVHQWLYSSLAVVAISLCGLFSVAVIPIMQKWFYHTLLQFLVGLAVGSLSGDALLHLMPHALLGHEGSHDHDSVLSSDSEKTAVWRGFAALGGVFFFFVAERLLGAFTEYRKQRKERKAEKSSQIVFQADLKDEYLNGSVGKKLSQYRKNSYDDFRPNEKEMMHMLQTNSCLSSMNTNHSLPDTDSKGPPSYSKEQMGSVAETVIVLPSHHGHGHSHDVPQSVSAVAWMVIMGDGLHNFCDGLAIGAAFASGVEGGISTTVAVFCHELPHELGDFAMLLKTGMKVKQALFYNGLSSVLCFVGMVIGVSLGNVHSATSWVFAGTAGMFLYIALVDMLPELSTTSNDPGSPAMYHLAIQVLGICTGVSIMLLIANYEQDLQSIVS